MKQSQEQIIIGYFNIRGKAQVPRLLCEYSNLPYSNKLYSPKQFLQEKLKNPKFALPYLKKGKLQVYGPQQMSYLILTQSNNDLMIGKNQQDKVKVKMYCWSIDSFATIIGMNSLKKPSHAQLQKQWEQNLKLKLKKYQKACLSQEDWFLGYLTLIDFSIYELVRYMDWMFPEKMKIFPNLCKIKTKLSVLPQIKAYENNPQSVKQISPQKILQEITNLSSKITGKNEKPKQK